MQTPQAATVRTLAEHLAPIHPADIRGAIAILRTLDSEAEGIEVQIDSDCQAILDTLATPHSSFTAALHAYARLLHTVHDEIFGVREESKDGPEGKLALTQAMNELERIATNLGIDVYFDSRDDKNALLVSRHSLDPIDRWLAGVNTSTLTDAEVRAKTDAMDYEKMPLDTTGGPPKGGRSNVVSIDTGRRAGWKDAAAAACTVAAAVAFGRFGDLNWQSLASIALLVCIVAPGYWLVKRHAPEMLTNKA